MNEEKLEIKLAFITGLKESVLNEQRTRKDLHIIGESKDAFYLDFSDDFTTIKNLRSISRAYIIVQSSKNHPLYISNHKAILGNMIEVVLGKDKNSFKTFKISCAGSDSPKVRDISEYIQKTYGLIQKEDADLKIHIIKIGEIWEIGIQITPRPLSLRDYKVSNMSGAMDPTIACTMNSLCGLARANSYLNIFSGSGTLAIEAGQCYPNLEKIIGFDNDKKHISLAIQNIKKAGLIRRVVLKEGDIFDKPDLGQGKFDVITSDLPFGMAVSKDKDLNKLYGSFVEYCEEKLNQNGKLAVYTSEYEVFEKMISGSKFKIVKKFDLQLITAVNSYLYPKIFVCELR